MNEYKNEKEEGNKIVEKEKKKIYQKREVMKANVKMLNIEEGWEIKIKTRGMRKKRKNTKRKEESIKRSWWVRVREKINKKMENSDKRECGRKEKR